MVRVPLSTIAFDAGTQIRAAIDPQVVTDYAEAMTAGARFPPIVVFHDGNRHYLADGFHRYMAAQRNQWRELDADVRPGTKEDALWFALGANRANGKRLTDGDKRHAIEMALRTWPDRSQNQIAEQIGVNQSSVSRVRDEVMRTHNLPARVTGKDGKSYPASRGANQESAQKREAIAAALSEGRRCAEIASSLGVSMSTITAVKRELGTPVSDKSRTAVAQRRDQMREMTGQGYTSRQIAAALGLSEEGCRRTLRKEGIDVPADRVIGRARRHDANRIIDQMVDDAENLTADVGLIEFAAIDHSHIAGWLARLSTAKRSLESFIRKLKEQQKHHEAA